ncbi:unnamed protein product, partial [Nesidiocoris tenuis]
MPIKKIPSDSSLSPNEGLSPIFPTVETQVFRRKIDVKLNRDVNTIQETTVFTVLTRRKREIIAWTSLNLVVILMVTADVFSGIINQWLLRVMQGVAVIICVCNLLYYFIAYMNVRKEAKNQKIRFKTHCEVSASKKPKKMEFVKYLPHDATAVPSYLDDFQSIYERFKRMAARNRIAFFPNETYRRVLEVTPPSTVQSPTETPKSTTDRRYMFSETLAKYKGQMITSARDLKRYLTDHRMAEEFEFVKTSEDSYVYHQDTSEFWSARRRNLSDNCLDVSPLLRRSEYQSSPSSSDSSVCSNKDMSYTNQEFFSMLSSRYKIEPSSFIYWISNFRMWLSKTVLSRIISEITVVDNGLRTMRLTGLSIGNVGLDTLEDASRNPEVAHQLPSLAYLLPFLRVSTKQHYIVQRFRTLAQGHGMGDFKWNVGGDIGGKPWDHGLPTDAELIMHLFATYLDLQLPLSPSNSNTSKPFSSIYVTETAVRKNKAAKVAILRQSMTPPHYNLLIDDEVQEIPPGRNNLFYAIVLFLHCIKTYENGMLGRISLGRHGIDMLWIIDEKDT